MQRMNIAKLMIPKVFTSVLHRNDSVRKGLEVMTRYGYTAVPVLDREEHYCGSVNEGDFLRYVLDKGTTDIKQFEHDRIGEIMRDDFCPSIPIEAEPDEVVDAIRNQNFVPIVDSRGVFCGILTRKSVISYLSEASEREQ